ncbi:exosortase Y-associated Wzy-like protein [Pseudopedobacter beijingensis]|uniref:Exosortase Y-associated Wzy-like protein n=1 Tax=Pseudopedobacter beijingensis TaxID=1207056 RepID=A0ABW4I9B0_9SPHI
MLRKYLILFFPLLIAVFLKETPFWSYLIAWLGSFYVFYVTWVQYGYEFSNEQPIAEGIMHPIFLIQAIFTGFMCCTSIFYFYDIYQHSLSDPKYIQELYLTAKSQRLSLLAHIALVLGIISLYGYKDKSVRINNTYTPAFYLKLTLLCYSLGFVFNWMSGLNQFALYLFNISSIAGVFLLVAGLTNQQAKFIWLGLTFFIFNFLSATLTGFKESIITSLLILFVLLFPLYKKTVIILSIPVVYLLVYILPTYAGIIRQESWSGGTTVEDARSMALEQILDENNQEKIKETNWQFLTERLSEISMFNQFVGFVPQKRDYYYLEIVENSLEALIPRVLWPNKPITELVAMERVYDAEVINRNSIASAKTRPVVDGYLSFGAFGIFISIFLYGMFVQWAYNKSENLFNGYELGGIVIFNGIFQPLWRGNNFEFILNNMVYGLLSLFLIYYILRFLKLLNHDQL